MSAVPEVQRLPFCFVHGRVHEDGTTDDDLPCREEEWPVVVLDEDEYATVADEPVQTMNGEPRFPLQSGDLAYIETLRGGLVPCKVLSVDDDGTATIQVTAKRTGWNRGTTEVIQNPRISLLNRRQVRHSHGQVRVVGAMTLVTDSGKVLP